MPHHFDTPQKRQERQIETCLRFERYCRRTTACIFTLTTALRLLGVDWDPAASITSMPRLHTDVLQIVIDKRDNKSHDRRAPLRPGVQRQTPAHFFVSGIPIESLEITEGITCTTPEFMWFMFSRFLELEDLVILGDALMRRTTLHETLTLDALTDLITRVERRARRNAMRPPKGIAQCRKALELMEERTDSVRETILRLTLERYGLPRPVVNLPLPLPDGSTVYLDLAFPDAMVAVEYDGRHHQNQWEQDSLRRFKIEAAGWAYVQVIGIGFITEPDKRRVAELVGRHIYERTGTYYVLNHPLPLERVPDRRRKVWKPRAHVHDTHLPSWPSLHFG